LINTPSPPDDLSLSGGWGRIRAQSLHQNMPRAEVKAGEWLAKVAQTVV